MSAGLAGQRLSVSTRFLLTNMLLSLWLRRQVVSDPESSLPNFSFLQKGSINGLSGHVVAYRLRSGFSPRDSWNSL